MSLIQILSYSQKKEFETPPILNNDVRKEIFTLPEILFTELQRFESDANQTFFIALYGYFKLNRILYALDSFSSDDIAYICQATFKNDHLRQIKMTSLV